MNKTAIKNFAIWARKKLISDITYKAGLIGINEKDISTPLEMSTNDVQFFDVGTGSPTQISGVEIKQRNSLVKYIREKESATDYKSAFHLVIEEVAYTWFNRLVAIRFMEVNDYLPSHIRVISSEIKGKIEPDIVTTPFETDLEFTSYEIDKIIRLKDENKLDNLFRMLFIKQCNKLNEILPELFETTNDYTEFLLNISFTDGDGIISHLINDIPEEDFNVESEDEMGMVNGQVEIIGWLYQSYITEANEMIYDGSYAKKKISKEMLPAATQLFTPDWPIRYMVENSIGKMWLEGHKNESLKSEWKYYLDDAEQKESVKEELERIKEEYRQITPEDIKVIDPCMGSGHILVYAFDVLMQIYESQGYTQRDAAQAIINNNLYGLDIDDRAYQLAYFAIMMKARKYDRRFLTRGISPKVYSIKESNGINKNHLQFFGSELDPIKRNTAIEQIEYLLHIFQDAKEYGSILKIDNCDWNLLKCFINDFKLHGQMSFDTVGTDESQVKLKELINIAEIMEQKYHAVITNPPYLGNSRFSPKLDEYVKENYPMVKSDLSMVMYKHAISDMVLPNGFVSFITTSSWLSLTSFQELRANVLNYYDINSLVDFGTELFDGKVGHNPIVAWVNRNSNTDNKFVAIKLVDYCYARKSEKANQFFNKENYYYPKQSNLKKIASYPIAAYWASDTAISAFNNKNIGMLGEPRVGLQTGENERFLRWWFEVDLDKLKFDAKSRLDALESGEKWFPYNKGGEFRKWYGNNNHVINWEKDGEEIRNFKDKNGKLRSVIRNPDYYFQQCITWSKISSGSIAFRYKPYGHIFDVAGTSIFLDEEIMNYIFGFCNSKVALQFAKILSPTLNYEVGHISNFPIIEDDRHKLPISSLVSECIKISKEDWDSYETSWDFITHPLVAFRYKDEGGINSSDLDYRIEEAFYHWNLKMETNFDQLKANEEELNRIFIDIYGLHNELTPDVEDRHVTIRKADLKRDIKSFISYAVGCMFGRYSLDCDGLVYAGGEWNDNKYRSFIPNKDNCILITDEEYFGDDIVNLFAKFVQNVYGAKNLEDNLDFIAKALGNRGNTSREVIRNYFIKDFYKDHVKTYQKRPIYWLYDSGKQNSFKVLVYMHRYNADTTGSVRVDYLHKIQKIYTSEIERMQDMIENGGNSSEISQAEKRKEKLVKQLKETKEYDEKIAHLALSRIGIDLDDGVKVNYDKVQTTQDGKKLSILAKI